MYGVLLYDIWQNVWRENVSNCQYCILLLHVGYFRVVLLEYGRCISYNKLQQLYIKTFYLQNELACEEIAQLKESLSQYESQLTEQKAKVNLARLIMPRKFLFSVGQHLQNVFNYIIWIYKIVSCYFNSRLSGRSVQISDS